MMNDHTYPTRHLTWVILLGVVATTEIRAADVTIGPYTFDDKAFASEAIQLDSGSISFGGGASTLDEALAGYTPATGLTNIGYLGGGNHFQLNFDVPIRNEAGNDLVFFDRSLRGNTRIRDDYEIALRPKDSDYTAYRFYDEEAFNDTDFPFGPFPLITLYSLAIDLSAYGLAEHAVVDSLRFRALPGRDADFYSNGDPQGDPVMAGILNPVRMYGLCVGSTDRTLLSSNRGGDAAASVAAALREFDRHKNPEDTVVLQFDYDEEGINSSTSVRESVEAFEQIVKPGDLFVFYVATHGTGGSNGVEIIGLNESGMGSQIYDWELTSWFDSDAWNEVNKLFILNTCHAGGFGYGNDGGAGTQDNLAGLPRSAILAACDEDGDTGSNWLTGFPSFTETVLDALQITDGYATADSNQNGLDFDELQAFVQAEVASKGSYDGYIMLHPASDDIPLETFSPTFYSWFSEDFELRAAGNFPLLGDVNLDGEVNGLDVDPFVDKLLNGPNQAEADMNVDGEVNGLDVDPFVAAVVGSGAHQIPEPSTLLLVTLGVLTLLAHTRRQSTL